MHASLARRIVDRATRPPALTWFAALHALVVFAVLARYVAALDGVTDAECRVVVGDFLAFHTGAVLVASGEGRTLYDFGRQRATQEELTGCKLPRWQPYVNPPLLAIALAPLARVAPRTAFHVFGALVTAALVLALVALGRALPALRAAPGAWTAAALLAIGFAPVASTLAGGQNTALTLAFGAAFYAALRAGHDARAGMWLGLLSYKPFLLPLPLLVLALRGRRRALGVACGVILGHYALGAAVAGFDWPLRLAETGARYRAFEWESNIGTHVSLLPFFERALPAPLGTAVACAAIALLALATTRAARRPDAPDPTLWGLTFGAALLASPHLQYYDVGFAVLPAILGVEHRAASGRPLRAGERFALAAGYLGYPLHALSPRVGFQPLTLALVILFLWLRRDTLPVADAGAVRS